MSRPSGEKEFQEVLVLRVAVELRQGAQDEREGRVPFLVLQEAGTYAEVPETYFMD